MKREWLRTKDHPAANGRITQAGEPQWNLDFESEDGEMFRIHVGATSRAEFLRMFGDESAKSPRGAVN